MTWDVLDTDAVGFAGITFSNGNLTALGVSGSGLFSSGVAMAREGKKAGKFYVEFTYDAASGNVDGVGVVPSSGVDGFIGNASFGNAEGGIAYFSNGHMVYQGSNPSAVNNGGYSPSAVVGMAIDLDNQRVWWTTDGTNWVGPSGTPDPATNTGGFDLSVIMGAGCRVFPGCNLSGGSAQFTANFGASSFTHTPPSGFTAGWTFTMGPYFGSFGSNPNNGQVTNAPPTNGIAAAKYTSSFSGAILQVSMAWNGGVGDMMLAVYDDSAGSPGSLLGVSSTSVSSHGTTAAGSEVTFLFSGGGPVLTSGQDYWFAIISDSSSTGLTNAAITPALSGGIKYLASGSYYPTFPSTFPSSPSTSNFRYPLIVEKDATSAGTGSGSIGTDTVTAPTGEGQAPGTGSGSIGTVAVTPPEVEASGLKGRTSQVALQALYTEGPPPAQSTQAVLQTIYTQSPNTRSTQAVLQVLWSGPRRIPRHGMNVQAKRIVPFTDQTLIDAWPEGFHPPEPAHFP